MSVGISVVRSDVADIEADVLLLKFARRLHGADEMIAFRLAKARICREEQINPDVGEPFVVTPGEGFAFRQAMFLGTPALRNFRYKEMRAFAYRCIELLDQQQTDPQTIATTVHGAGYGLDIEESLHAMIFGFQQAIARGMLPSLKKIVFVERGNRRFDILQSALKEIGPLTRPVSSSVGSSEGTAETVAVSDNINHSGRQDAKSLVFVAMPFSQEFEDVYQFGIYGVIRKCGFVCERVDESYYAGNIVERIKDGIRRSEFVVADLTTERPNVYLEVGFAWGLGKPVILVARDGQKLHFDLAHHKCIFYPTIGRLAEELERTVRDLFGSRKLG